MADKRKTPRKTARRAVAKKRAPVNKKPASKTLLKKSTAKKAVAKSAAKSVAAKSIAAASAPARKSVPIKKARVSKRALLPPLPPPGSARKTARSPARVPSRVKALGRAKTGSTKQTVHEIPACTEVVLRQKLRLAEPYIELWLTQKLSTPEDETTPEAAFVRLWQWLQIEAALEGSHVMITPDLVRKLFAEEMGRAPTL